MQNQTNLEFQIISSFEKDLETEVNESDYFKQYSVILCGRTESGKSVSCLVKNFKPNFFIQKLFVIFAQIGKL
jgi:hypothetical protein